MRLHRDRIAFFVVILSAALGGCAKPKPGDPHAAQGARNETKRHQVACASRVANDRVKDFLFDEAVRHHEGDRTNLDTLADYSSVRMEQPTVAGWDPQLDVTKCESRIVIMLPPGAERAFEGERQLQQDIAYTAQPAADGSGLVYKVQGAEPIITKLAQFTLKGSTIQPPAGIDEPERHASMALPGGTPATVEQPVRAAAEPHVLDASTGWDAGGKLAGSTPVRVKARASAPDTPTLTQSPGEGGEATIRSFYQALHAGNGTAAASIIIPEKRYSRAFAPEAMTRFYGGLRDPIQLTGMTRLSAGSYRVAYRYSAGRSSCSGSAIVSLVQRGDQNLIRSIRALNGC